MKELKGASVDYEIDFGEDTAKTPQKFFFM